MDITDTLAPNSDQLDAIDLVSGPRIFTVASVSKGNTEQPVNVHLAEFDRAWRPGKSMRRVLAACWGVDASQWTGRRVELFMDPEVTFGKDKPGGTRIARMSHIDGAQKIPLLVARGKSAIFTVNPLPDAAPATPEPTQDELAAQVVAGITDSTTADEVKEWGNRAHNRGLLDVTVDGETLRDRVTNRLADLAQDVQA